MTIYAVFFNADDRLRSGWRASIFLFAYIFAGSIFGSVAAAVLASTASSGTGRAIYLTVGALASLIPALLLGWLCGKFLEGLPFRALGASFTRGWMRHFAAGSVLGAATLALAVLLAAVPGGLRFASASAAASDVAEAMLTSMLIFAAAAAFEEAFFRGYMLQTLSRAGYAWLAIALTSAFFGAVHLGNPASNAVSTLNTALAGVWFGAAYLRSKDLWFPFGMHLMWNWTQGSVFGIEVSGLTDITPLSALTEVDKGPEWLTGGPYGIEGSIACTVAIMASIVALWLLPVKASATQQKDLGSLDLEGDIHGPGRMGEPAD